MSCPALTVILAWIGLSLFWILCGLLGVAILKTELKVLSGKEENDNSIYLLGLVGPILLVLDLFLWLVAIFFTPILFGKVAKLEEKVGDGEPAQKLIDDSEEESDDEEEDNESKKPMADIFAPKFKAGDIVTGIEGNPDGYKIVYDGCKCRVLSINEKGSMQLLLLDHIDKEAQQKNFGNVYKGPARNFILYEDSKYADKKAKSKSSRGKKKKL